MIKFLLLVSRQGKVRLSKWYSEFTARDRARITREATALVLARGPKLCNIVEYKEHKIVYKRYASLYFIACVDQDDNELITLECVGSAARSCRRRRPASSPTAARLLLLLPSSHALAHSTFRIIHHFVEVLDRYFGNVCELDIIFNFHKAYYLLDEVLINGELQESNKREILRVCVAADDMVIEEAARGGTGGVAK